MSLLLLLITMTIVTAIIGITAHTGRHRRRHLAWGGGEGGSQSPHQGPRQGPACVAEVSWLRPAPTGTYAERRGGEQGKKERGGGVIHIWRSCGGFVLYDSSSAINMSCLVISNLAFFIAASRHCEIIMTSLPLPIAF